MKTSLLKLNLKQTIIFSLLFLLFGFTNVNAQDPPYPDMRTDCEASWNCTAKEFTLNRIFLTDTFGIELGDALQSVIHPSMGVATEIIQRLELSENRSFIRVTQSVLKLFESSNFVAFEIRSHFFG